MHFIDYMIERDNDPNKFPCVKKKLLKSIESLIQIYHVN